MPINIPKQNPLTESQSELVSKISSMQNLLSFPLRKILNIPKFEQISTFDYLNKIMQTLGIQPEVFFLLFLDKMFDEAGTFMEENVLDGIAETLAKKGIGLPNFNQGNVEEDIQQNIQSIENEISNAETEIDLLNEDFLNTNSFAIQGLNEEINLLNTQLDEARAETFDSNIEGDAYLKEKNLAYFRSVIPSNFLSVYKQKIAKDLTLMIFGGKDTPAGEYLNPIASERDRLIKSAVCAAEGFDLSNKAIVKNQDIEFNRVSLKRQLESGKIEFEINCQTVKITLPEDPSFIFEGGGTSTIQGQAVTPAQNLNFMVNYVQTQTQSINNEQNANQAGKSFFRILIEKFIGYFSTIIQAYIEPVSSSIQSTPAGEGLTMDSLFSDSCSILNDPDNQEKKEFSERMLNLLLKALLSIVLAEVIKEFKKIVTNYFARTFLKRQKRKSEKMKARFGMLGDIAENAGKALKYKAAITTLSSIIYIHEQE